MTLNQSVRKVFSNYANFQGRATRSEFWWFYLFQVLITWALYLGGFLLGSAFGIGGGYHVGLLSSMTSALLVGEVLSTLFGLVVLIPWIALNVRRLHDVGISGWYLLVSLIPFVGLILMFIKTVTPSQNQSNRFGPVPEDYYV